MSYSPPYTITPAVLSLFAEIAGEVGRLGALDGTGNVPKFRRENRIRSIHASLATENNTLTLNQVTSIVAHKRVLGPQREIQEVKNAHYKVLATCDKAGHSTAFIEFLLSALLVARRDATGTDQVSDQVAALLRTLGHETLNA